MSDGDGPGIAEAARNLSRSLSQLIEGAVGHGLSGVQRVGAAVEAERLHQTRQLLLAIALLLLLLLGALFTGVAIIAAFWDTHRIVALSAVAGGYLLLAAAAGWMLWRSWRRRPPPADWIGQVVSLVAGYKGLRR